jgi:hypothetical protein
VGKREVGTGVLGMCFEWWGLVFTLAVGRSIWDEMCYFKI